MRRAGSPEITPGRGVSVGNRGRRHWLLIGPQVSDIFIRGGSCFRVCLLLSRQDSEVFQETLFRSILLWAELSLLPESRKVGTFHT